MNITYAIIRLTNQRFNYKAFVVCKNIHGGDYMKYICPICGYVYDEAKESVPFASLPESWVCPLCGAAKSLFKAEASDDAAPAVQLNIETKTDGLSPGALSAVFSNLARGCEKQYKQTEAELFTELSDYFAAAVPEIENADPALLSQKTRSDLDSLYPSVTTAASEKDDRGTLRIKVWGEKVTNIVDSILSRYEREGSGFLNDTQIWVCTICGFIYIGDKAPDLCPVCKVPDWKFEKIEGRRAV